MVDWSRLFKRKALALNNSTGVSQEGLRLLADDFKVLHVISKDLPERVLQYVVDGEDGGVLEELRKTQKTTVMLLAVQGHELTELSSRGQFFLRTDDLKPEVLLRLAYLYQAGATGTLQYRLPAYGMLPEWLGVILYELSGNSIICIGRREWNAGIPMIPLEQMAMLGGCPPDLLIRQVLINDGCGCCISGFLKERPDFSMRATAHRHVLVEALNATALETRLRALEVITDTRIPVEPISHEIVACALSASKKEREAAGTLLTRSPATVMPLLEEKLINGTMEERLHVLEQVTRLGIEPVLPLLERRAEEEISAQVRTAIEQLLLVQEQSVGPAGEESITLPPLPVLDPAAQLSHETIAAFRAMIERYNQQLTQMYAHSYRTDGSKIDPMLIEEAKVAKVIALLHGKYKSASEIIACMESHISPSLYHNNRFYPYDTLIRKDLSAFHGREDVTILHFVRVMALTELISCDRTREGGIHFAAPFFLHARQYQAAHGVTLTLREVGAALATMGVDPDIMGLSLLAPTWYGTTLPYDFAWPFFLERPDLLLAALGSGPLASQIDEYRRPDARKRALQLLGVMPVIPQRIIPILWDIALGLSKIERPLAQAALGKLPNKDERIVLALTDSKGEVRAVAAEWLGRLGARNTVPALQAALKKEKQEVARVAMLNALQRLGVPIDELLNRTTLAKEAADGLKKGIPELLAWFPFDCLPTVHWVDTTEPVSREILTWWIVQQVKVGTPEPGPLLRCYRNLLNHEDSHELALFVLKAWLVRDQSPKYTYDEALAEAQRQRAQLQWTWGTVEQAAQELLAQRVGAMKEKGMLALVAAFGDGRIVPLVQRYVKEWYGQRMAQCKALVRVLAANEHPLAIQLLLAVATRFRTKGIQQEAEACVKALAERNEWTVDELADRTIPTAGFDDGLDMLLDYGSRQFTARFTGQEIILYEGDRSIKALPDARKDEDDEKVKEAKKALSQAKKELNSVLTLQRHRLYEAMCVQRVWRFEDWDLYLNRHPIMRHLCKRLVWQADHVIFRPLDDGTFTGVDDNPVYLSPDTCIRLAHSCTLPSAERARWLQHFVDYEVTPLFDQLSQPDYTLPDENREETELLDCHGHLIDAFKLRTKATALGYLRGANEDSAWFSTYVKRFPGVQVEAVLEFSGNTLPEENKTVALKNLAFFTIPARQDEQDSVEMLPLGAIPSVLLNECWNDLRLIAAEGTGFDPDWEHKVNTY